MWFELTGDQRITESCATEGCGGQPTWRLEAGGIGSNYCSGCKAKIEEKRPLSPPEQPTMARSIGERGMQFHEFRHEMKNPHFKKAMERISSLEEENRRMRDEIWTETQRRERFEEDVWCAHKWLDDRGIPRTDVGGEVFSLVGRMMRLAARAALSQEEKP